MSEIKIENRWDPEQAEYVRERIMEYNFRQVGHTEVENFSLFVKDTDETVLGAGCNLCGSRPR